jgi:two-component system, chemotaxis family, protein-glutamate methylesterase/glutaminase
MTEVAPTVETTSTAAVAVVVAIGSSADGVQNLGAILSALPNNFPGAVLIVQHRGATAPSILARLLARRTTLSVKDATDGEPMRPGTVYIAPVGRHLIVRDGHAGLTDTAPVNYSRPSVDVLFEAVAKVYGARAIGVVLSGASTDGARGLQAIRRAGGRTIVQSPVEAAYSRMPSAAIAGDGIEFVLGVNQIGPLLAHLAGSRTGGEGGPVTAR